MKQFGKGFTLNQQQSTYQQLVKLMEKESEKRDERKNSKRSRAHRLDEFIKVSADALLPSCADRIKAIRGVLDLHAKGFITDDNVVKVVSDIVKGE